MRVHYDSDIHLEFMKKIPKIQVMADVLCLAGDIGYPFSGIYKDFLIKMSTSFKKVFLIAGNHEYYNKDRDMHTIEQLQEKITSVIAENNLKNVSFLNRSTEEYEGVTFVGATLWSDISHLNTHDTELMNDFFRIQKMDFQRYYDLHREDYKFLSGVVQPAALEKKDKKMVIMTHHMPSFDFIADKYKLDLRYKRLNAFFATDCSALFQPPVTAWIYGHTHTPGLHIKDGITFACNPKGYPSESQTMAFHVLEVKL